MGFVIDLISGNKAAKAQKDAARDTNQTNLAIYNDAARRSEPFLNAGYGAQDMINAVLGITPRGVSGGPVNAAVGGANGRTPVAIGGFDSGSYLSANPDVREAWRGPGTHGLSSLDEFARAHWANHGQREGRTLNAPQGAPGGGSSDLDPDAAFRNSGFYTMPFDEGQAAIEGGAAARGGLLTGQTAKDVVGYNQNLASNRFSDWFRGLQATAGQGQIANTSMDGAGARYGSQVAQTNATIGNANAQTALNWGQAGNSLIGTLATVFGG